MTQEHLHFEDLVSEISGLLSHVPFAKVNQEIARGLDLIRHSFGMDCCGLMEVDADRKHIQMVSLSWGEKSERLAQIMPRVNGSSWVYRRVVEEGRPMAFSSLEKLPPEANGEKGFWQTSGIESLIMIPLYFEGRVTHLLGLANSRNGRELPENNSQRLGVLGEMVAKEIIHRSDREALLRRERELGEAERVASLGIWEWDVASGGITGSEGVYRILGLAQRENETTYETFLAFVHPRDRDRVKRAIEEALSLPDKIYNIEHTIVRPDGSERVVQVYGEVVRDSDGNPVGMLGTTYDITERRRVEGELERALEEIKKLREQAGFERVNIRGEVKFLNWFPDIVGMSDPLRYVLYRIGQVAPTKTTVLLQGETGTGKGLFARALHEASNRKDKPFVNVNCAGLAPNLIESELFGREKGAFTGSTARQIGRFELADGGTIFLDEIGELPLDLQSKLLKVIESGEFERLGSPRSIKVDVRVVASTNRNITEEIDKGRFRRDLLPAQCIPDHDSPSAAEEGRYSSPGKSLCREFRKRPWERRKEYF